MIKTLETNKWLSSHKEFYNVDEAIALLDQYGVFQGDHVSYEIDGEISDKEELSERHAKIVALLDLEDENFINCYLSGDGVEAQEMYEKEMKKQKKDPLDFGNYSEWKGCESFGYENNGSYEEGWRCDEWCDDYEMLTQFDLIRNSIIYLPNLFKRTERRPSWSHEWEDVGFEKKPFDKFVDFMRFKRIDLN